MTIWMGHNNCMDETSNLARTPQNEEIKIFACVCFKDKKNEDSWYHGTIISPYIPYDYLLFSSIQLYNVETNFAVPFYSQAMAATPRVARRSARDARDEWRSAGGDDDRDLQWILHQLFFFIYDL